MNKEIEKGRKGKIGYGIVNSYWGVVGGRDQAL
jgi:hypothetical protein